jgi:hypothetical protein
MQTLLKNLFTKKVICKVTFFALTVIAACPQSFRFFKKVTDPESILEE